MKRSYILIVVPLIALLALFSPWLHRKSSETISVSQLKNMLSARKTFIVQIELEGCPACEQLNKAERTLPASARRELVVLRVSEQQKESERSHLKELLPSFEYYPSIFAIENGHIVSEFDLSTLDSFKTRFTDWRKGLT